MIFKVRNNANKKSGMRFVGVQVPHNLYSYLTLYSIAFKTTRSKAIREALLLGCDYLMKNNPEHLLVKKVIDRVKIEYSIYKKCNSNVDKIEFVNKMKKELARKGVQENTITEIEKKFYDTEI